MKTQNCRYCGGPVEKGKCRHCGEEPSRGFDIASKIANKSWFKKIITPYSIISSIIWTCCCIFNISSIAEDGLGSYLGVALFGYALFITVADILYYKKHPPIGGSHQSAVEPDPSSTVSQISTSSKDFDQMEGHEFEHYCAHLLKKNGFKEVEVTKGSGDQGIDIIAHKDGIKYGIQCKCYATDIGNKAVQEAFAGKTYYGCHIAAVLTNRSFTKSAEELADKNGVLLWDRSKLLELAQEHSPASNTSYQGRVAKVEEAREIMQPHLDLINNYYRNRSK